MSPSLSRDIITDQGYYKRKEIGFKGQVMGTGGSIRVPRISRFCDKICHFLSLQKYQYIKNVGFIVSCDSFLYLALNMTHLTPGWKYNYFPIDDYKDFFASLANQEEGQGVHIQTGSAFQQPEWFFPLRSLCRAF